MPRQDRPTEIEVLTIRSMMAELGVAMAEGTRMYLPFPIAFDYSQLSDINSMAGPQYATLTMHRHNRPQLLAWSWSCVYKNTRFISERYFPYPDAAEQYRVHQRQVLSQENTEATNDTIS